MTTTTEEVRMKELSREIIEAQKKPFSQYAEFMNQTRGLNFTHRINGRMYTRFQVWLIEQKDKAEIERLKNGTSTRYTPTDKTGWKNGRLLAGFK
jgi:hypothetical protein